MQKQSQHETMKEHYNSRYVLAALNQRVSLEEHETHEKRAAKKNKWQERCVSFAKLQDGESRRDTRLIKHFSFGPHDHP